MKITQVFNGYCDPGLYGVVVKFAPGGKEHSAYIDLELRTDQLRTPIEAHQGEGEGSDPVVQVPATTEQQILEAALAYTRSPDLDDCRPRVPVLRRPRGLGFIARSARITQ